MSLLEAESLTLVMSIDLEGRFSACCWVSVREEQIKVVAATSGIALTSVTAFRDLSHNDNDNEIFIRRELLT